VDHVETSTAEEEEEVEDIAGVEVADTTREATIERSAEVEDSETGVAIVTGTGAMTAEEAVTISRARRHAFVYLR
jgi:hypothetical protein